MRAFPSEITRALLLAVALTMPGRSAGQAPGDAQGTRASRGPLERPSFTLIVVAPEPAGSTLMRHLELARFREVTDLDEAEIERLLRLADLDARRLLGTLGFFNPRIEWRHNTASHPPNVTLRVEPGDAARVRDVDLVFEGDIAGNPGARGQREAVRTGWRLSPGQPWTQPAWDAAKAQALRTLVAHRYLRGRIADSQARIDAQAGRADLGLRLDSGPAFFLGPLQVLGIERYDPVLVPRLARLPPGADYDEDQLTQAQLRLTRSGYFESAFLHIDPASDPQAAPVQVSVREAPLQRLALGLGLTTDRGPRTSLEHRHNRVPGIGWRADSRLALERRAPLAQTEWTALPDERGWRWGVLAGAERIRDEAQVTQARRLRVGRRLDDEPISRHGYVQLDRASVREGSGLAPAATGDGSALTAHYLWSGRYFDSATRPARGYSLGLEAGFGLALSGPRGPFQRTVLRGLGLLPLPQGRLQLRAEGGMVLSAAQTRVPSTQRFRTGGDTTVRGYGFRDIGTQRPGEPTGPGRYLVVGSIEWQRPWRADGTGSAWEHTLFADAGLVTDRGSSRRASVGLGTGLRFASPVGPLQADLAYGLRTRRLRLHLSVGVTF
ncbi:MAG: hypothetical protein RIS88_2289 [Pseudomonadota bacterium]